MRDFLVEEDQKVIRITFIELDERPLLCYHNFYMVFSLKQIVAFLLFFVLLWSCVGVGIGMIGHTLLSGHDPEHTEIASSQNCCATDTTGESSENTTATHHTLASAVLVSFEFAVLVLGIALCISVLRPLRAFSLWCRSYLLQWKYHWAYFALLFRRLFSGGILHSKAW
ncbi:MAG: hypothetical protein A3C10_04130 [Candidatus Magasanikbacteria bacterium RIFCSPHIGHO2_02_FULL_48_18]|nr:MAG: hypothetical protein A3I74_04980 [Candidatus Magasanikbacteria bacterium RIFCSPLOWO2_02_FULL_47_16]OGH79764.1 MAG: hypothetical protein A3C10_04130 [Candidatus Magasanikbacteria bacterium RIFCSPHIGHO2_02_FULL_48_18]